MKVTNMSAKNVGSVSAQTLQEKSEHQRLFRP